MMITRVWQLRCLVLLTCILFASFAALAQDDRSSRRSKVISFSTVENVNELYVAIMGEIAKPGTYHLDSATLKLHSVLERSGGFTSDASKYVSVIRQGRLNQKMIYSESVDCPLFPGDILIAEAKHSMGDARGRIQDFAPDPHSVPATYAEPAPHPYVQIALLNVLDYPVVLKLRPEDANAHKIIAHLGQPITLLSDVDVITPERRLTSDAAKQAISLVDGSVIVVKQDRVHRNRLPATLPKPIESEIAFGAQSGLIGNPQGQSPALRTLGDRLTSSFSNSFDSHPSFSRRENRDSFVPAPSELTAPVEDQKLDVAPSVAKLNPRIANVPFSGSPRITNSSSATTQEDRSMNDPIPNPDDSLNDSRSSAFSDEQPVSMEEPVDSTTPQITVRHVLMIFSIVGMLIGAALFLHRLIQPESLPTGHQAELIQAIDFPKLPLPAAGVQIAVRPLLERLIKNELPTKIESVEFPEGLMLQGRIAPKPILRVDGPQSILKQNGPHFPASPAATDAKNPDIIAQLDASEATPVPRPHFIGAEKRKVPAQSVTSHAPAEIDTGLADNHSKAPLAKALFELEQGGRS